VLRYRAPVMNSLSGSHTCVQRPSTVPETDLLIQRLSILQLSSVLLSVVVQTRALDLLMFFVLAPETFFGQLRYELSS